jgi:cytochrome c oxidase assembly protein Cox11
MTIALIKGSVSKDGVVTLTFKKGYQSPAAISMGANNVITINEVNQLSLDFSASSKNIGANGLTMYQGQNTSGSVITTFNAGNGYTSTIPVTNECFCFSGATTTGDNIGDPIDSGGEIIVNK